MKTLLLILVVFVNGETRTGAQLYPSEQACQEGLEKSRNIVLTHNARSAENKVAGYAMACAEPVKAEKGPDA